MFAAVGNHVEGLERVAIGNLEMVSASVGQGEWRFCTAEDFEKLGIFQK
jgi:16S rRNA U516 pseudouridylate synthase RsuA-like enzyme